MVYCIGLTGTIASGKTLVTKLFAAHGIEVFSADAVAKALTAKDQIAYQQIVEHFSPEILCEDGQLNRRMLRDIIFTMPSEKLWLEELLHPLIRKQLQEEISHAHGPYCIIEIPLLMDKKSYPYLQRILLIDSLPELQIERVIKRDNCTREQALAILTSQPNTSERLKIADDVIHNDGGIEEFRRGCDGRR